MTIQNYINRHQDFDRNLAMRICRRIIEREFSPSYFRVDERKHFDFIVQKVNEMPLDLVVKKLCKAFAKIEFDSMDLVGIKTNKKALAYTILQNTYDCFTNSFKGHEVFPMTFEEVKLNEI